MTRSSTLRMILVLICSIGPLLVSTNAVAEPPREPTQRECDACRAVMTFLGEAITSPVPMDRNGAILEKYLATLDPRHVYFLAGDVRRFREQSRDLARLLKAGELSLAYDIFAVYRQRVRERSTRALEFLATEFDDPQIASELTASRAGYCENSPSADDRLISQLLVDLARHRLPEETLAGHKARIVARFRRVVHDVEAYEHDDLLDVFLNAVVQSYDPHAGYMSDKAMSAFNT